MTRFAPLVRSLALAVVLTVLLVGCQSRPQATVDEAAVRDTLLQHARAFSEAYVAQDLDAIANAYTDSAIAIPGGQDLVRGPDAIRELFRMPDAISLVRHEIHPVRVDVQGSRAYDVGRYEMQAQRGDSLLPTHHGTYAIVWLRTDDGWKMDVDMWASRPAPDTTAPDTTASDA